MTATLHITPLQGGVWGLKIDGDATPSIHPTEGQAVAVAYQMTRDRDEAEVIVHDHDGSIRSSLRIRRPRPSSDQIDVRTDLELLDDEAARAEAIRITPSNERLREMVGKFTVPPGTFDDEEAPY